MLNLSLEDIIKKEFSYLFDKYMYEKTYYEYRPDLMGNEGFNISNQKTMISFTKDRDQLFIYFGHPGLPRSKWYGLHLLLRSKNIVGIQEYNFKLPVEEQARHLSPIVSKYCIEILLGDWSSEESIIIAGKVNAEEVLQELTRTQK